MYAIRSYYALRSDSWYRSVENAIRMRAGISQIDATSAEDFSRKLVSAVSAKKPPAVVRIGKKSLFSPLLKELLPTYVLDRILSKKFGLSRIQAGRNVSRH